MINKNTYNKRVLLTYSIIALFFCLLSTISLFFNEWIVIPSCIICSIMGYLVTLLHVNTEIDPKMDTSKSSKFVVSLLLRYVIMGVGLALVGLLVLLTMGDVVNKYRYLIMAVAAVPYFIPTIALLVTKYEK